MPYQEDRACTAIDELPLADQLIRREEWVEKARARLTAFKAAAHWAIDKSEAEVRAHLVRMEDEYSEIEFKCELLRERREALLLVLQERESSHGEK